MELALDPAAPRVHEFGNVLRHVHIARGDVDAAGPTCGSSGFYETAMQDQAALGPEGGLAIPAADGGVDLFARRNGCTSTGSRSRRASALPRSTCA